MVKTKTFMTFQASLTNYSNYIDGKKHLRLIRNACDVFHVILL